MYPNIAILSTVVNKELYNKTSQLFPSNIQKYVFDGTTGMYGLESIFYMMIKLKNKGIDWLIMVDEDVIFLNPKGVFTVIEEMKINDYIVSGIRDGGVMETRQANPYVINTFFSIINFKELELIWNKKEVLKNNYIVENEFEDDLKTLNGKYETISLYEPYYCFYLWLRRKGKRIHFLNALTPFIDDRLTTLVNDSKGNEFLYHTWYARSYGINKIHTDRINKILRLVKCENINDLKPKVFIPKTFLIINNIRKLRHRIIIRIQIVKKSLKK